MNTINKLDGILNDVFLNNRTGDDNIVLFTSRTGMVDFDSAINIEVCRREDDPFDALSDKYRKLNLNLSDANCTIENLKSNWIVKLLIKLKLIKI